MLRLGVGDGWGGRGCLGLGDVGGHGPMGDGSGKKHELGLLECGLGGDVIGRRRLLGTEGRR